MSEQWEHDLDAAVTESMKDWTQCYFEVMEELEEYERGERERPEWLDFEFPEEMHQTAQEMGKAANLRLQQDAKEVLDDAAPPA